MNCCEIIFRVVETCHDTNSTRVVGERDSRAASAALQNAYRNASQDHPCFLTYSIRCECGQYSPNWTDIAREQDDMLDLMLQARGCWQTGGAL